GGRREKGGDEIRFHGIRPSREGEEVTDLCRLNLTANRLKQSHLVVLGGPEKVGAQLEFGAIEPVLPAGDLEASLQELGPRTLASHPAEEIRVVIAPSAKRVDRRHHFGGTVGIMFVEPGSEQWRDLVRQPHG